jgi:hypothetical protein
MRPVRRATSLWWTVASDRSVSRFREATAFTAVLVALVIGYLLGKVT